MTERTATALVSAKYRKFGEQFGRSRIWADFRKMSGFRICQSRSWNRYDPSNRQWGPAQVTCYCLLTTELFNIPQLLLTAEVNGTVYCFFLQVMCVVAQLICDADMRVINCSVKWPGSVHDARILRELPIYASFESPNKPLSGFILGDSGYMLRDWLMTPIVNVRDASDETFNTAHAVTRSTVERCIGLLKRCCSGNVLDLILTRDDDTSCKLVSQVAISSVCFCDHHLITCQLGVAPTVQVRHSRGPPFPGSTIPWVRHSRGLLFPGSAISREFSDIQAEKSPLPACVINLCHRDRAVSAAGAVAQVEVVKSKLFTCSSVPCLHSQPSVHPVAVGETFGDYKSTDLF